MTERANPFGDLDDFATAAPKAKAGNLEVVDQVAEQHGFPSRQPTKPTAPAPIDAPRTISEREKLPSRRKLTGRSEQVNIKTTFAAKKRLMEISVERDMPLGEILELALEKLEEFWGEVPDGTR